MHVFLAGATGVLGRALIPAFLSRGHRVTAMVRSDDGDGLVTRLGATPVRADARSADDVQSAVQSARPDVVVNELTALPDAFDPKRLTETYAANDEVRREGTANLLLAAAAADVPRFVTQSVAFWYAPVGDGPKSEADRLYTDAPEPIGAAVRTIRDAEQAALAEPGVTAVVLRYGHLYGPGTWYDRSGDIVGRIQKRAYPIVGDGAGTYSFVHVDDAVSATMHALENVAAGIYNVVDDDPAPARDWIPALAAAVGAPSPRRVPALLVRLAIGRPLVEWMTSLRGASNAAYRSTGWAPGRPSWRQGFRELAG